MKMKKSSKKKMSMPVPQPMPRLPMVTPQMMQPAKKAAKRKG